MSYGFGFYRHGAWFGFGQIQFRRWAIDLCLLKSTFGGQYPDGYSRYWLTFGH